MFERAHRALVAALREAGFEDPEAELLQWQRDAEALRQQREAEEEVKAEQQKARDAWERDVAQWQASRAERERGLIRRDWPTRADELEEPEDWVDTLIDTLADEVLKAIDGLRRETFPQLDELRAEISQLRAEITSLQASR